MIFGSAAPGYSSQQATAALEDVFHQTDAPRNGVFDHMGMSYQEQKARQGVLPSLGHFRTFHSSLSF